ncbi:MAG: cation diffusion facilitator family transporter [Terrimicrobiaceae bacterium]
MPGEKKINAIDRARISRRTLRMGHDHDKHGHQHHAPADFGRAFLIGIFLNGGFIVLEVVFGLLSDSLALLADAGHNLADVLGLVMAWAAAELAKKVSSARRTYGWKRATVLAALFNALLLLIGVGAIVWEAIQRFHDPPHIEGRTVIWVAALGIAVNGASALLFLSGRDRDLNVRGAFLHMAADTAVSAGVMLAGAVILFTGWGWLDPLVSLLVGFFILLSTWELLTDSLNLSLDAVPESVDPAAVRAYFAALPEVAEVHHLHIWALSTTEVALTAHLVKTNSVLDDALLARIREDLLHRYGIGHPTIQFECAACEETC